ncbi:ASCH domain-containing protein [Patescibacteria group bacterium]|nr:ASCH domain-containing protein [Patescibacteria group bacterium]
MQGDHVRVSCPTCGWETVLRRDVKTHEMKLNEEPFNQIENGEKKYELRLNDEKRKQLRLGDHIVFSKLPELNEKLEAEVISLEKYQSFHEMYKALQADFSEYSEDEFVKEMYKYYSPEDEQRFGVLAISIKLVG